MDYDDEVLYCYEIQVHTGNRIRYRIGNRIRYRIGNRIRYRIGNRIRYRIHAFHCLRSNHGLLRLKIQKLGHSENMALSFLNG
jgi:aromatic ring-cleaving dioxygenase